MTLEAYEAHILKHLLAQQSQWLKEQQDKHLTYEFELRVTIWKQQYLWKVEHNLDSKTMWNNRYHDLEAIARFYQRHPELHHLLDAGDTA